MNTPSYPPHDPRYIASPGYKVGGEKQSFNSSGFVEKAKGRKWSIAGGVVLAALLGGFYYYSGGGASEGGGGSGRGGRGIVAAPVRVTPAIMRDMPVVQKTIGTVVSVATVSITSRVQGQLIKAHFQEGQMVKTGDLLFTLDKRPFEAALAQARATLQRDLASAADAERNKARYASLTEQGAASSQQRDTAATTAETTSASAAANRAAAETAALNLSFTEIRSPIDGKTGPILIQPGNIVTANSANPLVVVSQIQPIKVSFALPQGELPKIQQRQNTPGGLVASVSAPTTNGLAMTAPIDFVGNAVSATSGTIELRATFPNAEGYLVPGQLVDVTVELNKLPNAIVVPRTAIQDGPGGQFLYVVENDRAVQQDVKVLFDDSVNVAIEGNVKAGDQVITDGQLRVLPGQAVQVLANRDAAAAPAARAGAAGGREGGRGRRGQTAGSN